MKTPEQREAEFRKELAELLEKHDAEMDIGYMHDHEIIIRIGQDGQEFEL